MSNYKSIIISGDWHIQNQADADRIDKVLPRSSAFILMGDLIDVGLDRGMQWNQDNVTKQIKYLKEILTGRKVLGYVLGNHEDRIIRKTGLNPYESWLGSSKTNYYVGLHSTRYIAIEHGTKNNLNPLVQLRTLAEINPSANIVALGHDHTLGIWREGNQWLVRTGHLQPYPKYARKAILKPKPMGYIKYSIKKNNLEVVLVD